MAQKKIQAIGPIPARRELIELIEQPSIRQQCELLNISRGAYYYEPCPETPENLALMLELDQLHMDYPAYGSRRMQVVLERKGHHVNRKRVVRLLDVMGIQALYPRPRLNLSEPGQEHQIYPYLLRDLEITGPNQVWCSDITYIPMQYGFMYLVAVMDWWSRYVLAWELSNTMESEFCIRAWEQALAHAGRAPLICNTDQGSQFTSPGFIDAVQSAGSDVSMDVNWTPFFEPLDSFFKLVFFEACFSLCFVYSFSLNSLWIERETRPIGSATLPLRFLGFLFLPP